MPAFRRKTGLLPKSREQRNLLSFPRKNCRGLSLVELLVTLLVVCLIFTLFGQTYGAHRRAESLTRGGNLVAETWQEARELAITRNLSVEVRLYDVGPMALAQPQYQALQLFQSAAGTTPAGALSGYVLLPPEVVIDATREHSPLLTENPQVVQDAGDFRANAHTRVFHFLADGSTDLEASQAWFVTLRDITQDDPRHFPANWACVQLDPTMGRVRVARP